MIHHNAIKQVLWLEFMSLLLSKHATPHIMGNTRAHCTPAFSQVWKMCHLYVSTCTTIGLSAAAQEPGAQP